jgi:hypothetical protein
MVILFFDLGSKEKPATGAAKWGALGHCKEETIVKTLLKTVINLSNTIKYET